MSGIRKGATLIRKVMEMGGKTVQINCKIAHTVEALVHVNVNVLHFKQCKYKDFYLFNDYELSYFLVRKRDKSLSRQDQTQTRMYECDGAYLFCILFITAY